MKGGSGGGKASLRTEEAAQRAASGRRRDEVASFGMVMRGRPIGWAPWAGKRGREESCATLLAFAFPDPFYAAERSKIINYLILSLLWFSCSPGTLATEMWATFSCSTISSHKDIFQVNPFFIFRYFPSSAFVHPPFSVRG